MAFLEIKGLKKQFGDLRALDNISFGVEQGSCLAIIGSSGGGKTTLLRCLNFLERPDEGQICLNGALLYDAADDRKLKDEALRQTRLHFGLVFQNFNLFPQYTALENVSLALRLTKAAPMEEIRKKSIALLERVGLGQRLDSYPHMLSGGQQQRVAIARALAAEPDVLCFDEPTSALDPELTGEVLKTIRALREQKITMVIVTHEIAFAREVADRVLFIDEGMIVEQGDAKQVIDDPQQERTRSFLCSFQVR